MAFCLALAAVYIPTPYVLNAPGRAVAVSSIISIEDPRSSPVDGQFLMTTVLSERASVLLCIYAMLDPAADLNSVVLSGDHHQAQGPPGVNQMELAQYISTRVALESLGFQLEGDFKGLRILNLLPNSPNQETLAPGDLLLALNGQKRPNLSTFRAQIEKAAGKQSLPAIVSRSGKEVELNLKVAHLDGKARIGVLLRPEYTSVELPVKVDFHSGNTSGASGGLVFALEIYDRLDRKTNLARGRVIAATGTLEPSGQVGPIEGLKFKLVGAERAGAQIFLVPRENWPEIENQPTSMTVIPVSSFEEALRALR